MIRVGILSFSDGRKNVHNNLSPYIQEVESKITNSLLKTGEVEVYNGEEIIHNAEIARKQAVWIASCNPDAVILNIPVFAFPNLAAISRYLLSVPCIAIAPVNGQLPGLGGLMAAVNMIRQSGMNCDKLWGNIDEEPTLKKVLVFLRAAQAATRLKGQVFGLIGGRSIGMGSGTVNPDLWMKLFGVDVEHIDQLQIVRKAGDINEYSINNALDWLKGNVGMVNYDMDKLTEDTLKLQIRHYYATKELIDEFRLDFLGVKCHYELSEYYVTQCLSAALINDPYDFDGAKEPVVYSCEADCDGALTMQVMKLISGKPVLFFDFRHYDDKDRIFSFCNCGAMSTWYADRSENAADNLKMVKLNPVISKYSGKGCHVQYIAKEGKMTFGRFTRVLDKYKLILFSGEFTRMPEEKLKDTCLAWPHGYVKVSVDPFHLIDRYESNHVHGVCGDYIDELRKFCDLKDITCEVIE